MADKCVNISIEDRLNIGEVFGEFGGVNTKYEIAKSAVFDLLSQGRVEEAMKIDSLDYLNLAELDMLQSETLDFMESLSEQGDGDSTEFVKVSFSARRTAIEHANMASTEHIPMVGVDESAFKFKGMALSEFKMPTESKSRTEDLLTFNEIFFADRLEFIPEFTAVIGADVRNLMYGARMYEGETMADLSGPSTFISNEKYKAFLDGLEARMGLVQDMTHEEITKAFLDGNMAVKSSFYAYVAFNNIELLLDTLFTGATFSLETDARHTPKESKRIKKVKGIPVLKEFAGSMDSAITHVPRDIEYDVQDPQYSLNELKEVVSTISSDKGKDVETIEGQFIIMKNVPRHFNVQMWNTMNPSFPLDTTELIPIIRKNDVFQYINGNLVRISPPYEFTYNTSDKHKVGHEEDFNALNNDAEFLKFMIKSTPRYNEIKEDLHQDTIRPFFSESEFYALAEIISEIPDTSFLGIREFLEDKVNSSENVNTKLAVLFRSMYYTYFAPEPHSFIPIGSEEEIDMAPLGELAAIKNYKVGDAVGHDIISAMVQFFSKQSVGRINVNDGEITEINVKGNKDLNIQLPPTLQNAMFEFEGKLIPEIANKLGLGFSEEGAHVTINAGRNNNSIVKLTKSADGNRTLIDVSGVNISTAQHVTQIFSLLQLPPKFTDNRFISKFFSGSTTATVTLKANLQDFIGKLMVVAATHDVNKTTPVLSRANKAVKGMVNTLANRSIYGFLRTSIDAISDAYEDVHGMTSSVQEITAEGNLAAKYTNLDRETDFETIWTRGRTPYSAYGIDIQKGDDDVLDYFNIDNNPVLKEYKGRVLKDSIAAKGEVVSNQAMTLQQRSSHMVEHMFFNKLTGNHEKNHFFTQPMVYSDRSSIYMHKFELDETLLFLKQKYRGNSSDDSYLDPESQPTFFGLLKQNYIKTYRDKYDTMQWNVLNAWTDFLLSPELDTLLDDPTKIPLARALGYKLTEITREEMRGENQLKELLDEFSALELPMDTAIKSSQLTQGISVVKAEVNGKNIAIPTATPSLMVEFLQNDTNAAKFVNDNMENSRDTFKSKNINFTKFSPDIKQRIKKFFGSNVSFDEALNFYHLTTAPINDGMIDTLMSPDTEYGKNSMTAKLAVAGKKLTSSNWNEFLDERTQNFIKQSKRVQSMGSKGIRPRLFRSYMEFSNNLPKEDLILGISEEKMNLVRKAPDANKVSVAYHAGILTKLNGAQTINGAVMVTVGSIIVPIKFEDTGIAADVSQISPGILNSEEFTAALATVIQQLKQLQIIGLDVNTVPLVNAGKDVDLSGYQSKVSFEKVLKKLNKDQGEHGLGLEYASKNILIDEDQVGGPLKLLGALGMRNSQHQDSLDAVQWAHPLYFIKLSASLGNQFSSFSTDGSAVKDLTQTIDPKTGRLILQKKSTQNIFSNEILTTVGNEKLHNMFKIMNTSIKFPPITIDVPPVDEDRRVVDGPTEPQVFEDMQGLWEYFGSYFNPTSWQHVGEVIANYPQIRNEYVEKIGFTSGQKTGHSSVNNAAIVLDSKASGANLAISSVRNDAHIVMLQKYHESDSSEAAEHKSTIAIPSQFLSAMAFEGRTPREALQVLEGVAGLTFSRLDKFYMGISRAISQDDDQAFKDMEDPLFSKKYDGKKFSELNYSEIDSQAIEEFDTILNNKPKFKKKLYTKLAIEKIVNSLDSAADTEVLLKLLENTDGDVSFNSLILRKKATTTVRSAAYNDNVKTTLPGVIAVTSPADFVTSVYTMPVGRLSRMDAIKYALTTNPKFTTKDDPGVLPTDKVKITFKNGETILEYAGKVGRHKDIDFIEYAVLPTRNKSLVTRNNQDLDPQYVADVLSEDIDRPEYFEGSNYIVEFDNTQDKEVIYRKKSDGSKGDAYKRVPRKIKIDMVANMDAVYSPGIVSEILGDAEAKDPFRDLVKQYPINAKDFQHIMGRDYKEYGILPQSGTIDIHNKNTSLDIIAQNISYELYPTGDGTEVTEQEIIDEVLDIAQNPTELELFIKEYKVLTSEEEGIIRAGVRKAENDKVSALVGPAVKGDHWDESDFLLNKVDGTISPVFYIMEKFKGMTPEELDATYELYTDVDEDLNWYKYKTLNGKPLESTEEYKRNYILNKDPELYNKLYIADEANYIRTSTETEKDKINLKLDTRKYYLRERGRLRKLIEDKGMEVILPEVYAPNFNLASFDLDESVLLTDIIGFSDNKSAQKRDAQSYFREQIRNSPSKFLVKKIGTLTVANYVENIKRFKKLAMRESEDGKRYVYKQVAKLMETQRAGLEFNGIEFNDTAAQGITKVVNDFIYKRNFEHKDRASLLDVASGKRAKSFVEALEVMPPRIPGQGKQSGFLAKIKGFVQSNKNAIYSPRESYANTGQDNDIDTNNVITRAIDHNGYQYEYKDYRFSYNAEGKPVADPNGSIIDKNGYNPKLEEELKEIEENIRSLAKELEGDPDTEMSDQELDSLIYSKLKNKREQFEKSIQNFVIDQMKAIMKDPKNMVEMETPISMDTLKAITDVLKEKKATKEYNYETHGVNSFNSAWIPVLEELNMQGKVGIADYANGQRTYAGILSVQESIGRPLQIGRGWRSPGNIQNADLNFKDANGNLPSNIGFTIAIPVGENGSKLVTRDTFANTDTQKENREQAKRDLSAEDVEIINEQLQIIESQEVDYLGNIQAWETLSQLLSAATDNAKELILGQIKANSDTNGIIATMIILGFEFEDVYNFLTQPQLKKVFDTLENNKNDFEATGLKGVLGAKDKLIPAERDLKDLLSITDSMNEFRRVLTMAQNNRIDTHDLYKVLEPVYVRTGLTPGDVVNGNTNYVKTEIYPKVDAEVDDAGNLTKNAVAAKIFNPLFYIHAHPQANSLLKSAIVAEQMVAGISEIDNVLKTRIVTQTELTGKMPDAQSYENLNTLVNDLVLERYLLNKKAYLPLPAAGKGGKTLEFDLSDPDLRSELVYSIGDSVAIMRNLLSKANKASDTNKISAVLDAIQVQSSKVQRGKKIVTIPFLMDANEIETSMLQASIKELDTISKKYARELSGLKDALFYAALIQTKGKSSRNSIISLFPEQYLKFSEEIATYDLLTETSAKKILLSNSEASETMLSLIAQKGLKVHKIGENGKAINYNPDEDGYEDMSMQEQDQDPSEGTEEDFDDQYNDDIDEFTGNTVITPIEDEFLSSRLSIDKDIESGSLFKINHGELLTDVYINATLSTDIDALTNIPIKLIRRNSQETLSVDTLVSRSFDEIEGIGRDTLRGISMAGFDLGLPAILSKDITTGEEEKGRVLAYLGKGEYAVLNAYNNVVIMTDLVLATNNPDKIFFGHNFREGTFTETSKARGRSWQKGAIVNATKVNGMNISTKNSVISVNSEDGTVVHYNNYNLHKDIINYIFEDKTFNGDASIMETLLREGINDIDAQDVTGFTPGTDEDVLWFMKKQGVSKIFKDEELKDTTWAKNPGDITTYTDTNVSTFAAEYIKTRNINKNPTATDIDRIALKMKAILKNEKNTRGAIKNKNMANSIIERINKRAEVYLPVGMVFTDKDMSYIRSKHITPQNC